MEDKIKWITIGWNGIIFKIPFGYNHKLVKAFKENTDRRVEETEKSIIETISKFNEEKYGHCKDSCESQEYDAINNLIKKLELNSHIKPSTK